MNYVKLNVGDKVWFYDRNHEGELTEGKVVHVFKLEDSLIPEYYVIMIEHEMGENFEVRNGLTVSDDPNQPIGLWRNITI